MKNVLRVVLLAAVIFVQPLVCANDATSALGTCLVDNLNGKERKNLAKWIFFAIAAHPEINRYSNATASDLTSSDRFVGALITRLMTENCPDELRAANRSDPQAIERSFELVGQVAMQELMGDKNVMAAITSYAKYADQEKINKILLQ